MTIHIKPKSINGTHFDINTIKRALHSYQDNTSMQYLPLMGFTVYTYFPYFLSKTYIVGTRLNRLAKAVLMCTNNL